MLHRNVLGKMSKDQGNEIRFCNPKIHTEMPIMRTGTMRIMKAFAIPCFFFLSCDSDSSKNTEIVGAMYVLPFPVGEAYMCSQGFNTSYSHTGSFRYSVDFDMPIGTVITAAQSGRVVYVVESNSDNDQTTGHENVVIVMHEDSTYARYVHLTLNGALVERNRLIMTGDTVGLSGNSGSSASPHLHFDVTRTFAGRDDQTIPFDFRNTILHPSGMQRGVLYEAYPY